MTPLKPSSSDDEDSSEGDREDSFDRCRSRHDFRGCRTNLQVLDSVLVTKKHLLGDMSRLRVFAVGDGEGGQALRSNNT